MAGHVRLDCPLCGTMVWDVDGEPAVGRCPTCDAVFLGPADDPRDAAAVAARQAGLAIDTEALARGLFAIGPGHELEGQVAVTSDRRASFYRWWVVVRGEDIAATLSRARS